MCALMVPARPVPDRTEEKAAAERLQFARERAGFASGPKAAALAHGWAYEAYKAHETGRNRFTIAEARKYAAGFGVSDVWLLLGKGPMVMCDEAREVIQSLDGLSPEQLRQVLDFVNFTKAKRA